LSFSYSLFSQDHVSSYKHFSINDGLADNSILDIIKDQNDIVWIATKKGLSRFDGLNFINFNYENSSVFFKSNRIDKLYRSSNFLYLLSKREGLIKLNTITMEFKRISHKGIESIDIVGNTSILLFSNAELVVKEKGTIKAKRVFTQTQNGEVVFFNNKIYCSIEGRGIQVFDLKLNKLKQIKLPYKVNSNSLIKSKQYGLVYNSEDSVYVVDDKDKFRVHPGMMDFKNVNYFKEDIKGMPLFIKNNLAHYSINDKLIVQYFENIQNIELRSILRLNDNSFVIGTNQGLILLGYHKEISHSIPDYNPKSNNEIRVRRKIVEDKNGHLYFLGYPGLVKLKKGEAELLNKTPFPSYDGLIKDGTIYFTTEGAGFYSYSIHKDKFKKHITADLKENDFSIHISIYNDDILLIAGKNGIVLYNISKQESKAFSLGDGIIVYDVEFNKDQQLYYAATNQGLIPFSLDYFKGIQKKEMTHSQDITTKDILLLPDMEQVWLATNEGLFIRDLNSLRLINTYNTKKDLTDNTVAGMLRVNDKVWVSTFYGITIYDLSNNTIKKITQATGLKNIEFNYKSFCLRSNGNLVFGGLNAFEEFDLQILDNDKLISDFKISAIQKVKQSKEEWYQYSQEDLNKLDFKTGVEELKIYLSNKDFAEIDNYRFVYSINNQEDVQVQNNIINISSLSYGSHSLIIKMFDKVGVKVNEKAIELIAFVPFYKRTSFFQLLVVVLFVIIVLLIILGFYTFKFHRRSKLIEIQTKNQIAMDLHDEVGSLLTGLLMHTESTKAEKLNHYKIKTGLNRALFSLSNYINSHNRSKISISSLEYELREFLFQNIDQTKIKLNINTKEYKDVLIPGKLYRDMKLCFFEAVNNSKKHAYCKVLNVDFSYENQILKVRLEDDGILESTDDLEGNGNGIMNLKNRTSRNKGKIKFSIPEKKRGLIIEFIFFLK
jgi:ligand-binding sensor domain-containing protein